MRTEKTMSSKKRLKCAKIVAFFVFVSAVWYLHFVRRKLEQTIKDVRKEPPPFYMKGTIAPHNFNFIINNNDICSSAKNLTYLIYVFTRVDGFEVRRAIRETWGRRGVFRNIVGRVVFMLGATPDKAVQDRIHQESRTFRDIVQEDFIDSYVNLSFKGIMASKWIADNCQNAKYIIKVDDDIVLDIFKMVEFLKNNVKPRARSMYCHVMDEKLRQFYLVRPGSENAKELSEVFIVSDRQFTGDRYPEYCHGMLWVGTPDLFIDLYRASYDVPFVQIEDAFTTGILRNHTGTIHLTEVQEFYETRIPRLHMYDFYHIESYVPVAVWGQTIHAREVAWQLMLCRLNARQKELAWEVTYNEMKPPSCEFHIPLWYYIPSLVLSYLHLLLIFTLIVTIVILIKRNKKLERRLFNLMKYVSFKR